MNLELFAAYCQSVYRVATPRGECDIRVARRCWQLETEVKAAGGHGFAFITACNPQSQQLSVEENARRSAELEMAITAGGWVSWPAVARGATEEWPPEAGFCVLSAEIDQVRHWLIEFSQYAAVVAQLGERARLLFAPLPLLEATLNEALFHADPWVRMAAADLVDAL